MLALLFSPAAVRSPTCRAKGRACRGGNGFHSYLSTHHDWPSLAFEMEDGPTSFLREPASPPPFPGPGWCSTGMGVRDAHLTFAWGAPS